MAASMVIEALRLFNQASLPPRPNHRSGRVSTRRSGRQDQEIVREFGCTNFLKLQNRVQKHHFAL